MFHIQGRAIVRLVDRLNRIATDHVTMHIDDIKDPQKVLTNKVRDTNVEIRDAVEWFVKGLSPCCKSIEEFLDHYKEHCD